jgi:uncharacterized phage protein (TIGR01671 family)
MREIKFRAWDLKSKKMIDSVGLLPLQCVIIPDGESKVGDMGAYRKEYVYKEPDGYEIMQFTGLKDKNGKEIYEGDIITEGMLASDRFGTINYKVHFREDLPGCVCFSEQPIYWSGSYYDLSKMEIIGNIYENPEPLN